LYQDKVDFIVYPSSISNSKTCNVAFHPNFVEQYLRFDKVITFKIESIQNEKVEYAILEAGTLVGSNIIWRSAIEKDYKDFTNHW
jgi:hypothetical protein